MSRHLDLQLILEDFNARRAISIVVTCGLIMLLGAISLSYANVYSNKARLGGLFIFFTDFKANVQEYYGYRQSWPDRDAMARYMASFTEPDYFKDFRIDDYGWNKGSYWFSLAGSEKGELDGIITLTPSSTAQAGTVIWLCGYAARKDTGETPVMKSTVKRQYLPGICQ